MLGGSHRDGNPHSQAIRTLPILPGNEVRWVGSGPAGETPYLRSRCIWAGSKTSSFRTSPVCLSGLWVGVMRRAVSGGECL